MSHSWSWNRKELCLSTTLFQIRSEIPEPIWIDVPPLWGFMMMPKRSDEYNDLDWYFVAAHEMANYCRSVLWNGKLRDHWPPNAHRMNELEFRPIDETLRAPLGNGARFCVELWFHRYTMLFQFVAIFPLCHIYFAWLEFSLRLSAIGSLHRRSTTSVCH